MIPSQFKKLEIGDIVLSKKDAPIEVLDIDRQAGTILTGGTWRKFRVVKFIKKKSNEKETIAPSHPVDQVL